MALSIKSTAKVVRSLLSKHVQTSKFNLDQAGLAVLAFSSFALGTKRIDKDV
jgi:hypothetical protein